MDASIIKSAAEELSRRLASISSEKMYEAIRFDRSTADEARRLGSEFRAEEYLAHARALELLEGFRTSPDAEELRARLDEDDRRAILKSKNVKQESDSLNHAAGLFSELVDMLEK